MKTGIYPTEGIAYIKVILRFIQQVLMPTEISFNKFAGIFFAQSLYKKMINRKELITKLAAMLFACLFFLQYLQAQCSGPTINTFPYHEDFENDNGNWVIGGSHADWAWGTPAKTIINTAGSGSKCWITGGLNPGSYSSAENSWILSPCFDFSAVQHPYISFKIFWETEKQYDGGGLQYSVDGGNTWLNTGTASDAVDCYNANWYNQNPMNGLQYAWSGTVVKTSSQGCLLGNGIGAWVIAKHTMPYLAGQPNVQFRFTFIAGTSCNSFDGFAIDDVFIGEIPVNTTSFTYQCSKKNIVAFINTSTGCMNDFLWDFGDLSSGSNNSSNLENPFHAFSSPGQYTISFTTNYTSNAPSSITKKITVFDVSTKVIDTIKCYGGNTGSAAAFTNNINAVYNYSWNTVPVQTTNSIKNLIAGTYIITASADNTCSISDTVTLTQPAAIAVAATTIVNSKCNNKNGTATVAVTGGITPYQYYWSSGNTTPAISQIYAGTYSLKVTDANNCSINITNIKVNNTNNIISVSLGNDTLFCPGRQLVLDAGNFAGNLWQDNSTSSTYTVTQSGKYWVKVTDIDGCTASDTIKVIVDCSDIFFPNAFTPNHDGLNDSFGPGGNLTGISNYTLFIYNRWGELVFQSHDPYFKWDGKFKGYEFSIGSFVWISSYSINRQPLRTQKGVVSLLR